MSVAESHPRPQMTRPDWVDLCGTWDFAYDDANTGLDEHWYDRADVFDRKITLPFPPESPASGIDDPDFHPYVWYRRTFEVADDHRSGRTLLHFGAVDYRAHVWVNGHLVATHEGGHTPFSADITSVLVEGKQTVVVRAEDDPHDRSQPRGKQDWELKPHAIWYRRTTGIWQPVWLEHVPITHVARIHWTPRLAEHALTLEVRISGTPSESLRVRSNLSLNGDEIADIEAPITGRDSRVEIPLDPARLPDLLWSPDRPTLLDATVELLDGESVVDTVQSYTGLRSSSVADGYFLLNGEPTFLRLVLGQNYWPESNLVAPSAEAIRREVELIQELGFNGVRIHQKVEDPRFLYWCDRLGVMVWGEMANAYVFTPDTVPRFTREWMEVVERDRSHSCIIAWVPFNESWGVPDLETDETQRAFVRAMYHLTKTLDPTRPVIGNDGWEHVVTDILSIHDYTHSGSTLRDRYGSPAAAEHTIREERPAASKAIVLEDGRQEGQAVMLTEFGGVSYAPAEGEEWYGYGTVSSTDEYLTRYEELVMAVLDSEVLTGFCYTQLTDTIQETNGLLTERRMPKLDIETIREINTRPSRAMARDASST
jgi:beta-galactosidase/beta-glucuronidase